MKEQVGVDDNYGCIDPGTEVTCNNEVYTLFPVSEIIRLKRLGDNVKNKLEEARKLQAAYKVSMEECKPEYCDCNSICTQEKLYTYFKSVAELLESLDK